MTTMTITPTFTGIDHIDLLIKARARVKVAWFQGYYAETGWELKGPDTCGVCALGAIRWAQVGSAVGYPWRAELLAIGHRCHKYLNAALHEIPGFEEDFVDIVDFNDGFGRTQEQVIELFDRAIELALADDTASKK